MFWLSVPRGRVAGARDARFKLIHNLRAGQAKAGIGIDGDAALTMARSGKFPGTQIGLAFERAADPPEFELYDLQADPWEFEELAQKPEHAATLTRMKDALLAWRRDSLDPLLTPEGLAQMAAREGAVAPRAKKNAPNKQAK